MTISWTTRRKRNPRRTGISPRGGRRRFLALLAVMLSMVALGAAQDPKPKKGEVQPRSLSGIVTTADGKPAARAVVLLENTKTKAIVSFYSQNDGSYFFHELAPEVDYRVSARLEGDSSAAHTVSAFNSRKDIVINLKIEKK